MFFINALSLCKIKLLIYYKYAFKECSRPPLINNLHPQPLHFDIVDTPLTNHSDYSQPL